MLTINSPNYEYQVGGSLPLTASSYVTRQADEELYQALLKRQFCYVLSARQMGKSSLRIRTMQRLRQAGVRSGVIDMTTIGSQQIRLEQWYASVLQGLASSFKLSVSLPQWWRDRGQLSPVQCLSVFLETVLLTEIEQPIVIFIDEIDSVLSLDFSIDDFFALIRACHNQRAEHPTYRRLTFALFGVATPSDLIADKTRTPFNIGCAIELRGFQLEEALPLLPGLQVISRNTEAMLGSILGWTNGQPFLTQKVCQLVVEAGTSQIDTIPPEQESGWVNRLVRSRIIDFWEIHDEPEHLRTIAHRLLYHEQRAGRLLGLYQQLLMNLTGIPVNDSREQIELLLSGLVVKQQGRLHICNRIYAAVFNCTWVEQQLADLRPYAPALAAWRQFNYEDESRLLQGQALKDAQTWAEGKSLGDLDYRFLAASQKLAQRELQIVLDAERAQELQARLQQEQKTARLQRYLLGAVGLSLIVTTGLGLLAFQAYRKASISEIQAITRVSEAMFASNQRLSALVEALRARRQLQQVFNEDAKIKGQVDAALQQAVYGAAEFNRLSGHQEFVYSVAIDPGGQLLATASRDKTIKLWSRDGTLLRTLKGHQGWVTDVTFSPDGKMLASTSEDGTVKLWQKEGHLIRTLSRHQKGIFDTAFSPNGQMIASASWDNTIKLWQLNGQLIRTIKTNDIVLGIAFSPNGQMIASAGADQTINLWSLEGQLIRAQKIHQGETRAVAFSPDGQTIASAGQDRVIQLWRPDGRLIRSLKGHTAEIWGLTFSPDGQRIASSSVDQTVKVWQQDGTLLMTLNQEEAVWRTAFSPDGTWLASAGSNNLVKLWHLNYPVLTHLQGHQDWVIQAAFSPNGEHFATVSWDKTVKLWTKKGDLLTTFRGHQTRAFSVAFHPDGQHLASADGDNLIKLWRPDGKVLRTFSLSPRPGFPRATRIKEDQSQVGGVDFSPDGQLLVAGNDISADVKVWRLDGGLVTTLTGFERGVSRVRFSPNGQQIVTASWDGKVKLWTLQGKLVHTFQGHDSEIQDVDFSPDGNLIASASHDQTVKVWTVDGQLLYTFTGHHSKVYGVAFSPDGKQIASGDRDRTIKIWQLDGTLLANLKAHTDPLVGLVYSPDGQLLVSTSWDHQAIIWNLQAATNVDRLEQIGCRWVRDYLKTQPLMSDRDQLCQGQLHHE